MSSFYKGLRVPDPADPADVPGAFRTFVDYGPVGRFANAAARDAAMGVSPDNGTVIYRNDTKRVEIWEDTVWRPVDDWTYIEGKPTTFPPDTHSHAEYLPLAGGTMTGQLNMGAFTITNVADPSNAAHVGDRAYNDGRYGLIGNSVVKTAVTGNSEDPQTMSLDLRVNTVYIGTSNLRAWIKQMFSGDEMRFAVNAVERVRLQNTQLGPLVGDDNMDLGASGAPWRTLYYSGNLTKPSSARLKQDIEEWDFDALGTVRAVGPKRFRWRRTGEADTGFVAEDMPVPIQREGAAGPAIAQDTLVVWLWQAVRQLAAKVEALEAT